MSKEKLQKYIITENCTMTEAMERIDSGAHGIVFVTDKEQRLCGSLSDGDIRRWLIKTADLSGRVSRMMNRTPRYLTENDMTNSAELLKKYSVRSIPVLDKEHRIKDIYFDGTDVSDRAGRTNGLSGIPVIVMAGGRGTRLYPYTKILPKPLIPIGDVPILERILDGFYRAGAEEFFLTVNYKKEMIKSYFVEQNPPYEIHYVEESVPLGTAGGVGLIEREFDSPVLITNCDTLIEADYKELAGYHKDAGNDLTFVSALKHMVVPYGVLDVKDGVITSIEEKPQLSYFINTGMYLVNPEFLEWIPKNRVFHMTDLAAMMIQANKQVGMYPVSENCFLDMGEFEEMKKMEERISGGHMNWTGQ